MQDEKIPYSPGKEKITENDVDRVLGVSNQSDPGHVVPVVNRIWKFPQQRLIPYRHRKLFKKGQTPDPKKLEHIPRVKYCLCEDCMVARKDFEDVPVASSVPISPVPGQENISKYPKKTPGQDGRVQAVESDVDELIVELMDPELAGTILDTFREGLALLYRGKNLGDDVDRIWEKNSKEVEVLGKAGKKCWDHYAKLPNFKYKDLMVLGFLLSKNVGLRIWATSQILKDHKKNAGHS